MLSSVSLSRSLSDCSLHSHMMPTSLTSCVFTLRTQFCQALTILIDDYKGMLPLNPTKQEGIACSCSFHIFHHASFLIFCCYSFFDAVAFGEEGTLHSFRNGVLVYRTFHCSSYSLSFFPSQQRERSTRRIYSSLWDLSLRTSIIIT